MRATLKAIADYLQDELDGMGGVRIAVHRDYAYGVAAPYVILQAPSLDHYDEPPLSGPVYGETGGILIVKSVHATTDGARWVADRVRDVLSPGLAPFLIPAGDVIEVKWEDSVGDVVVDRDVQLPNTNTHPAMAVEEYAFSMHPGPGGGAGSSS